VNGKVTFQCHGDKDMKWYVKSRSQHEVKSTSSVYVIKPATLKDTGWHYCYGEYRRKRFIAKVFLKVYGINMI